jgi:hypothetical protein
LAVGASIPANRHRQSLREDQKERGVAFSGLADAGSLDWRIVSQTGNEDASPLFLLSAFTISDVAMRFLHMCWVAR